MRKFIKFIAAACAAAIFTGSVSAVSVECDLES